MSLSAMSIRTGITEMRRHAYLLIFWTTVGALTITSFLLKLEGTAFYSFLLIAVMVSVALGGLKTAIATLLVSLVASVSFLEHVPAAARGQHDVLRLVLFGLSAIAVSIFVNQIVTAKAKLQRAEQKLALAINAAGVKTIEWNFEGARHCACVQLESFLCTLTPSSAQELVGYLQAALEGRGSFECELQSKTLSGTPDWLLFKGKVHKSSSTQLCFIGAVMDISSRKTAEEAICRSAELTAKAEITSQLAHEINNPLSSLMFSLYLLQQGRGPLAENWTELLATAHQQLSRVSTITQRILSASVNEMETR